MPDLTQPDPVDVGLLVLLTEPSYAAQTLTATARLLGMDPTHPMTGTCRERAIDVASDAVLRHLPDTVCQDSLSRLYRALPCMRDTTRGQYALRLLTAAKELG